MCAFPRPSSTEFALLKHKEVVTLFHGKVSLHVSDVVTVRY